MAISSKKLVNDFVRKAGITFSGSNPGITLVDIIGFLNESQDIWFRNLVRHAEKNPEVREDLKKFEVKCVCVDCIPKDDEICIAKDPENLYKRLNQKVIACHKECCGDLEKDIIVRMNQSDDINETRQNPFRKANFAYEQLNGDEGSEGLYIYHEGEMEIKKVCIDYYRKPNEIHAPSLQENCDENDGFYYDYCGRVIDQDSDFEVDCRLIDVQVVSLAIALYNLATGKLQYAAYQQQIQSLLTINSFRV